MSSHKKTGNHKQHSTLVVNFYKMGRQKTIKWGDEKIKKLGSFKYYNSY